MFIETYTLIYAHSKIFFFKNLKQIPTTISTKSQQKTCIQTFLKDLSMNFPYFPYLLRCYIFKGKIVLSKGNV